MPERFVRPDVASDEGGLWALMDREEARLRRSPFRLRDDGLQAYLEAIVARLAGPHAADVRLYPVRAPLPNASMAPNGLMQVWSGLLLRVDNEAQLASILGHEMAHYLQRHTLNNLRDLRARAGFATFLAAFGLVGALGQLMVYASAFAFSRDQEREADVIGQRLMRRAGYDPRESARVWSNLVAEVKAGDNPDSPGILFATHPGSEERAASLAEAAGDGGGETGAKAWQERIAPLRFGLLGDELRRDRPSEMLALLQRLIDQDADSAELRYFRGAALRQRGREADLPEALAAFDHAIQIGGEPPVTHRDRGYLLQRLGRAADARASFATYLDKAPSAPDAEMIKTLTTNGRP